MNTNENNTQLETINNYISLYNNLNDIDLKYSKDKTKIEKPKTIVIEVFKIAIPTVEWHFVIVCLYY